MRVTSFVTVAAVVALLVCVVVSAPAARAVPILPEEEARPAVELEDPSALARHMEHLSEQLRPRRAREAPAVASPPPRFREVLHREGHRVASAPAPHAVPRKASYYDLMTQAVPKQDDYVFPSAEVYPEMPAMPAMPPHREEDAPRFLAELARADPATMPATTDASNATAPAANATAPDAPAANATAPTANATTPDANATASAANATAPAANATAPDANATAPAANATSNATSSDAAPVTPVLPPAGSQPWDASKLCFNWETRQKKTQLNDPRQGAFGFVAGDELHIVGGCAEGSHAPTCSSEVQVMDLRTHTWSSLPVTPLSGDASLMLSSGSAYAYNAVQGRVYEFGGMRTPAGGSKQVTNTLTVLTKRAGQWRWVATKPAGAAVPPPLSDASLVAVGNELLVLMLGYGADGQFNKRIFMMFTDENNANRFQWTEVMATGTAPSGRRGAATVVVGDKIVVSGGVDASAALDDVYTLSVPADPIKGAWVWRAVQGANPSAKMTARAFHSAVAMSNNLVFIYGGEKIANGETQYISTLAILDVPNELWQPVPASIATGEPALARSRLVAVPVASGQKIMALGGTNQRVFDIYRAVVLDTAAVCENSCGANGDFQRVGTLGVCSCRNDFTGKFCTEPKPSNETNSLCPNNCGANGVCQQTADGKPAGCKCNDGFFGVACELKNCADGCSGHGICIADTRVASGAGASVCRCNAPFVSATCAKLANPFEANPSALVGGAAGASTATTTAAPATTMSFRAIGDSSSSATGATLSFVFRKTAALLPNGTNCAANCTGHGICVRTPDTQKDVCVCEPGFAGAACNLECPMHCNLATEAGECATVLTACPNNPNDNSCEKAVCKCKPGFSGLGCTQTTCVDNCNADKNRGICTTGSSGPLCFCAAPWGGPACADNMFCSNHGKFVDGRCQCDDNYGGRDCEVSVTCDANCTASGRGRCVGDVVGTQTVGVCRCNDGWRGALCDQKTCPSGCSGRGDCGADGVCSCAPGFSGPGCEVTLLCPNNCTSNGVSHGECRPDLQAGGSAGYCKCQPGWTGDSCADIGCPKDCSKSGQCVEGRCQCDAGTYGIDCSFQCPNKCSGNGVCSSGTCKCYPGFGGVDCAVAAKCPGSDTPAGECSGNGQCFKPLGKCFCAPGFDGAACDQVSTCGGCGINGVCQNGRCYCDPGYEGSHCEVKSACAKDCNNRGVCWNSKCFCPPGYEGATCELSKLDLSCPANCTGNGVCQMGRCYCATGYEGEKCEIATGDAMCVRTATNDTQVCSGKGYCRYGSCFCFPGASGKFCEEEEKCRDGCVSGQGQCLLGKCRCLPGFKGPDCSEDVTCPGSPLPCGGHGVCMRGRCACLPGFKGDACSEVVATFKEGCPNNCTDGGVCLAGSCFCVEGRSGADCSIRTQESCPASCNKRGVCQFGQCFCRPGFVGRACERELRCSQQCLKNGVCAYGHCFCVAGYTGENCEIRMTFAEEQRLLEEDMTEAYATFARLNPNATNVDTTCPGGCNFHGVCAQGKCFCDAGYTGPQCKTVIQGVVAGRCPNDGLCSGKGRCLFGKCYCDLGFGGADCSMTLPVSCPKQCSNQGACFNGKCHCDHGFEGVDCSVQSKCSPLCDLTHGVCVEGKCVCVKDYFGDYCNTTAVLNQAPRFMASRVGASAAGALATGPLGDALGLTTCSKDCGANGVCVHSQCYCKPGFSGAECSEADVSAKAPAKSSTATATAAGASSSEEEMEASEAAVAPSDLSLTPSVESVSSHQAQLAAAAAATALEQGQTSYFLLSTMSFAAGVVCCMLAQVMWEKHKEMRRQRATKDILKPLLHSIDASA